MVRVALTVALPEPVAVVRPSAFSMSASPTMLRSAPVEVVSVIAPPPLIAATVWPAFAVIVATPADTAAFLTPLAISIALRMSPTVAADVVALAPR